MKYSISPQKLLELASSGGISSDKLRILSDRFIGKIQVNDKGCWQWTGSLNKVTGYAQFRIGRRKCGTAKNVRAHIFAYENLVGPVPEGLELDHLCRNRGCANPKHVEPVTHKENSRRGIAATVNRARLLSITHCPQGHPYSPENTYYFAQGRKRGCRICRKNRDKLRRRACPICGKPMDRYAARCKSCSVTNRRLTG